MIKYYKLKKENEKLIKLLCNIRLITKGRLIYYDDNEKVYRPIKNTSKQDVYEGFTLIRELVKGNYVFLTDEEFIDEYLHGYLNVKINRKLGKYEDIED